MDSESIPRRYASSGITVPPVESASLETVNVASEGPRAIRPRVMAGGAN